MARRIRSQESLDERDVTLLQMLMDDYCSSQGESRGLELKLQSNGNVSIIESPTGWLQRLFGWRNTRSIEFWETCNEIKDRMMSDSSVDERSKKNLENYLLDGFKTRKRAHLVRRLFSVSLGLSELNSGNNGQNKENKEGKEGNQENKNRNGNDGKNSSKQDPPKRQGVNDGSLSFATVENPSGTGPLLVIPANFLKTNQNLNQPGVNYYKRVSSDTNEIVIDIYPNE